jgi:hypothetical protein
MSYSTGSGELSQRKMFPTFFRTSASDVALNLPHIYIMKHFGWNRVATIHQMDPLFSVVSIFHGDHFGRIWMRQLVTRCQCRDEISSENLAMYSLKCARVGLRFHEPNASLLLNQQDHSWLIWMQFSFTMVGHTLGSWNLSTKPCAFLPYKVGLWFRPSPLRQSHGWTRFPAFSDLGTSKSRPRPTQMLTNINNRFLYVEMFLQYVNLVWPCDFDAVKSCSPRRKGNPRVYWWRNTQKGNHLVSVSRDVPQPHNKRKFASRQHNSWTHWNTTCLNIFFIFASFLADYRWPSWPHDTE